MPTFADIPTPPPGGVTFTDLYQLTMAQLYLQEGMASTPAQFDVFFRSLPDYGGHAAGYAVLAGVDGVMRWLAGWRLDDDARDALAALRRADGSPRFEPSFLAWLRRQRGLPGVRVRSVAEGRVVHPNTPLAVVEGPLATVQLLETGVLNQLAYPTLVATKATRVSHAARGAPVLDFGMRRGQESAVHAGTRAALVGGVQGTSNTAAGLALGRAPSGTHAHSLVQAFQAAGAGELEAFRAYAHRYPDDCLLLVDTVDTLASGLPHAIKVFEELRRAGHRPAGIRLDSGDLAHLALRCARELDRAGFPDVTITLSNQLDELTVWQILRQIEEEAPALGLDARAVTKRLAFGVGTRLITSAGAPALDLVYKLVALRHEGAWRPTAKRSDTPTKATTPGPKGLHRLYDDRGRATADLVTLASEAPDATSDVTLHHPVEPVARTLPPGAVSEIEPLLATRWEDGAPTARPEPAEAVDAAAGRRARDEHRLDPGVRRLVHPHRYHVSLSPALHDLRRRLLGAAGGDARGGPGEP